MADGRGREGDLDEPQATVGKSRQISQLPRRPRLGGEAGARIVCEIAADGGAIGTAVLVRDAPPRLVVEFQWGVTLRRGRCGDWAGDGQRVELPDPDSTTIDPGR